MVRFPLFSPAAGTAAAGAATENSGFMSPPAFCACEDSGLVHTDPRVTGSIQTGRDMQARCIHAWLHRLAGLFTRPWDEEQPSGPSGRPA